MKLARLLMIFIALLFLFSFASCTCDDDDDNNADSPIDDDQTSDDDAAIDDDITDDDQTSDDDTADDDTVADDDIEIDPNQPSDEIGVFVSLAGDDANPGTMALPVRTIAHGLELAATAEKVVFVSAGNFDEEIQPSVSLYGGYDPDDWARDVQQNAVSLQTIEIKNTTRTRRLWVDGFTIERTDLSVAENAVSIEAAKVGMRNNMIGGDDGSNEQTTFKAEQTDLILEYNRITSPTLYGPDWGMDGITSAVELDGCQALVRFNAIHSGDILSEFKGLTAAATYAVSAGKSTMTLHHNVIASGRAINAVISISNAVGVADGEYVIVGNSINSSNGYYSAPMNIYDSENNTNALLIGNTMITSPLGATSDVLALSGAPQVVAVNNILQSSLTASEGSVISTSENYGADNHLTLVNNDILAAEGLPLVLIQDAVGVYGIDDVNACDWYFCKEAAGNISEIPGFGSIDKHLTAGSPCIDAGVDPSPWYDGSEILFDIDGDFRPQGGGWDIGMDEYNPN